MDCEKDKLKIYDVIIIGGGASGLSCGGRLKEKGIKVLLLEAQDYLGGRIKDMVMNNQTIQVGGEELHGIYSHYKTILQNQGVQFYNLEQEKQEVYQLKGQLYNSEQIETQYPFLDETFDILKQNYNNNLITEKQSEISFKNWLETQGISEEFNSFYEFQFGAEFGTSTKNISFYGVCKCFALWKYGEVNLMLKNRTHSEIIHKEFCNKLNYKLNSAVKQIIYSNPQYIQIKDINNLEYICKQVVLAVPITILKKESIEFIPQLPQQKLQAFSEIGMDKGGKIFLEFKSQFWGEQIGFIGLQDSLICSFYWLHNYHNKSIEQSIIIAGLISDEKQYEYVKKVDKDSLKQKIVEEFAKLFNKVKEEVEMELLDVHFQDWGNNQWVQGLYSYPGLGYKDSTRRVAGEVVEGRIHFVGEYLHQSDYATIHAAVQIGLEKADEININRLL